MVAHKPLYENERATAFWDVLLFADATQVKANRIDTTVIDKTSKQVRVTEMSCPWLENRESRDFEKTTKYTQLRLELTNRSSMYNLFIRFLKSSRAGSTAFGPCSEAVSSHFSQSSTFFSSHIAAFLSLDILSVAEVAVRSLLVVYQHLTAF